MLRPVIAAAALSFLAATVSAQRTNLSEPDLPHAKCEIEKAESNLLVAKDGRAWSAPGAWRARCVIESNGKPIWPESGKDEDAYLALPKDATFEQASKAVGKFLKTTYRKIVERAGFEWIADGKVRRK